MRRARSITCITSSVSARPIWTSVRSNLLPLSSNQSPILTKYTHQIKTVCQSYSQPVQPPETSIVLLTAPSHTSPKKQGDHLLPKAAASKRVNVANEHACEQTKPRGIPFPQPEAEGLMEPAPSPGSRVMGCHWSGLIRASCQTHREVMSDQLFALELQGASLFSSQHGEGR